MFDKILKEKTKNVRDLFSKMFDEKTELSVFVQPPGAPIIIVSPVYR